jgi:methionyl-tRNA synthetase
MVLNMAKNPFEIRADILAMAKDYMDKQYQTNMDFTKKLFEEGKKTAEEMQAAIKPYSIKDMMDKATEFYSFVAKKD